MTRRLLPSAILVAWLLSVVAAPAVASKAASVSYKFTGSEAAEPRLAGTGGQQFVFKPFTVSCEQAKSDQDGPDQLRGRRKACSPKSSSRAAPRRRSCPGSDELELKAEFFSPVDLNFNANGFVEAGAGGKPANGKLEEAGPVQIALSGAFKCTINVAAGTFPAKALKKPKRAV